MARLFEDGFDHYGTTIANMLDGAWDNAQEGSGISPLKTYLSTTQVATGTHSILFRSRWNGGSGSDGTLNIRKILPAAVDKLGFAARFYFESMPTGNFSNVIGEFFTSVASRGHVSCVVDANGGFRFYRGTRYNFTDDDGTLIAQTDQDLIGAGAWHHIEIQVYIHDTLGWIRVAVDGVHQYEATGLDTRYDSSDCSSIGHGMRVSSDGPFYMDDLYYYDFTGTAATDTDFCCTVDGSGVATNYIGELQVMWLAPNGNTADDDWLKSAGSSAFALVDEVDPDDVDYIYTATATDLTELDLNDLPEEITYIRGWTAWGRLDKSDAGSAMLKLGMESAASTVDSTEFPVTVAPTYYREQFNVDPATSTRWTRPGLNAADLRITRSA